MAICLGCTSSFVDCLLGSRSLMMMNYPNHFNHYLYYMFTYSFLRSKSSQEHACVLLSSIVTVCILFFLVILLAPYWFKSTWVNLSVCMKGVALCCDPNMFKAPPILSSSRTLKHVVDATREFKLFHSLNTSWVFFTLWIKIRK